MWTHKIDGLTESDFIFAAKADQELNPEKPLQHVKDPKQESEDIRRAVGNGVEDLRTKQE